MGTRFLTAVFTDGQYRVAQYGQWDGYPEGAGVNILHFLRDELDEPRFRSELEKLRFADSERLWELRRRFGADEDGSISVADYNRLKRVFPEFHRDTGEDILRLIQNGDVLSGALENRLAFAGNSLLCEWVYVVDFDSRTFEVYEGYNKEPLDPFERFAELECDDDGYYPVKLAASWPLDCLPADEEFVGMFVHAEDDDDE